MRKHQLQHFQPFFRIQEVNEEESADAQDINVTPQTIQKMIEFGVFKLDPIVILVSMHKGIISIDFHLSSDATKPYPLARFPISGFPRTIVDGDTLRRGSKSPLRAVPSIQPGLTECLGVLLPSSPSSLTPSSSDTTERPKLVPRPSLRQQPNSRNFYSRDNLSNLSSGRNSNDHDYPEIPQAGGDWARRRDQVKRSPPKPVHDYIGALMFERDGGNETLYGDGQVDLAISETLDGVEQVAVHPDRVGWDYLYDNNEIIKLE